MPSSSDASNVRTPGGRFHHARPPSASCGPSRNSHSHESDVASTRGARYLAKAAASPPLPWSATHLLRLCAFQRETARGPARGDARRHDATRYGEPR